MYKNDSTIGFGLAWSDHDHDHDHDHNHNHGFHLNWPVTINDLQMTPRSILGSC